MAYESPIRLITDEYALKLVEDEEQNIVKAVYSYGIDIDKDELVNLIHNDRNQYDKGYADGWRDMKKSLVRCKDCKHKPTGSGVNHDIEFPEQDYRCPCRCEDFWYSWMPDDDWFCANGERKEE